MLLTLVGKTTHLLNRRIKPSSGYGPMDGTSMATPHVSAVAALVWSARPKKWDAAQIRQALVDTAADLGAPGRDDAFGHGLVDAKAALDHLQSGALDYPPHADFSVACQRLACTFTDRSTDRDGRITKWAWYFGSQGTSTAQSPSFTFNTSGRYEVMVRVTDDAGKQSSYRRYVTVRADGANVPPVVDFHVTCAELSCTLKSTSWDSDGRPVAFKWTFPDGSSLSGPRVKKAFSGPGSFKVTLRVTDDRGGSAAFSRMVDRQIRMTGQLLKTEFWTDVQLSWRNTNARNVDLFRNGKKLTTMPDRKSYTDFIEEGASGDLVYKVCHAGTTVCSNALKLTLPKVATTPAQLAGVGAAVRAGN